MNNLNHSRTLAARLFAVGPLLASIGSAWAVVHYVDVNSTNTTPPYTSWPTAATNIQDALDAAVAGEEVMVTNGIYATGGQDHYGVANRVAVDKPLSLRSINGPQFTIIDGGHSNRCVYLTNGASLSGFSLTNGRAQQGGGLWCESADAVVSNCIVSGNTSFGQHPAFLMTGSPCCNLYLAPAGGAYGGTLNECILSDNVAETQSFGGQICDLTTCRTDGAGLFQTYYSYGAGGGAANATLNNCTLMANRADYGGGAYRCTLNNCTLAGNTAAYSRDDGQGYGSGGGAYQSVLNNCIVYFNDSDRDANYDSSCTLNYSCTTPLPTNGVGNITNEPAFVNPAAGHYRLRSDSPCIDAGTNLSASITHDLDGRPRPLDGNGDGLAAFDMGAYEYRRPLLVWQDSPNPTPPHADWVTAAHTIQDAVDAAVAGDEIVVTNGLYATGTRSDFDYRPNRVLVDKPLSLRSVNGPQFTIIDGGHLGRCVYLTNKASLSGFTLTNGYLKGGGGGAYGGTLNNCILSGNGAHGNDVQGGAGGGAFSCTLNNCTLTGNSAPAGGGASDCTLNNCMLTGNSDFGVMFSTLNNCTLIGNTGGGAYGCTLNNCIAYFNNAPQGANYDFCTLNYSCTTPLPTIGVGNISKAPLFVDQASGNLRLQSNSPCINAGLNALAPAGPDLDGNPRIVSGNVDIGAHEYQFDSTGGTITLNSSKLPNGAFQFTFLGAPNGAYTVLMKTDLSSPWTVLGPAPEFAPGLFTFREQQATNSPQRFYAVVNEFWPVETRACPGAGPNPCPCNPDLYDCIISPNGAAWKKNVNGRCPCGGVF